MATEKNALLETKRGENRLKILLFGEVKNSLQAPIFWAFQDARQNGDFSLNLINGGVKRTHTGTSLNDKHTRR